MNSDAVQVNVHVSPELLEKAKRYDIDVSDAARYGIEQLVQSQQNTFNRNILLSSIWQGIPIGCIPAVLLLLINNNPTPIWVLTICLVQFIGMFGGFIFIGRRKYRRYYAEHPEAAPDGWAG